MSTTDGSDTEGGSSEFTTLQLRETNTFTTARGGWYRIAVGSARGGNYRDGVASVPGPAHQSECSDVGRADGRSVRKGTPRRLLWKVSVAAAALVTCLGVPAVAGATPMSFSVTNGTDSGSGSLRAAIAAVDNDTNDIFATPDTITVTGGPFTVMLNTPLPQITRPVVLDGAGLLTINAANALPASSDALVLQAGSDESTVKALNIEGATGGAGIAVVSSLNTIRGNQIAPASGAPNKFGITVFSSSNTIGGPAASDGNIVKGNTGAGIFVIGPGASGPAVTANVIEGNTVVGNSGPGVDIVSGATANTIGGTAPGAGNAIYGNTGPGVLVSGQGSSGNMIDGNVIGVDPTGLGTPGNPGTPMPNGEGGITFATSASGNSVSGGSVFAGTAGSAIDAGGEANQVTKVSLAGGPDPLITGGQHWNVSGGAPTPTGAGFSIPVTVSGAPPGASVEVDLLGGSCTGTAATLPYLAGTTVQIGSSGVGAGTILASTDPPLPIFESSDADGPLNVPDPCQATAPSGPAPANATPPRITGDPVQGATLVVSTGAWTHDPTSFAFQWRECNTSGQSCHDIPGAIKPTYVAADFNIGFTIRVVVTATNAAGSSSATSTQTGTVTAAVGNPTVGPAQTTGPTVTVDTSCRSSFILVCELFFSFTVNQLVYPPPPPPPPSHSAFVARSPHRGKPHIKVIVVGSAKVKIRAGQSKKVRITLNRTGRRLLAKKHKLNVKLTITQNGHTVRSRTLTFKAKPPPKRKSRR